ncbi:MAG: ATP-binding cassette domain-containing protein [candidate division Zixibacteria bacterium]|nr:ATP-binding cassette domain-containing protein [candidate division Zixibacteria bacterium]
MHLRVENIRKEYDGKVAVDNLSLDVPKGAIFGIIGPNGAGKTTTIRMIMNIIAPDSGRILLDGREIDASFKDRVGYLPEERGLYKKMTVSEIVVYMAELKGQSPARTKAVMDGWLKRIQLEEYKDRKVEELSKGMAQKLQFVTTIIHDPEIVILDEIFSGLDPINIELIKDILLEMKRAGKTILFSTHVMEQAEKLCDYLCMISKGKKVIDGRLSDVKAGFGTNSVQIEMEGDGAFVQKLPGVISFSEFNNYVEVELEKGVSSDALLKALAERVSVRRFEVMEPSLYNIFINMAKVDPAESQATEGGQHV